MQTTQKLFQVFVQRDQTLRPSRLFARESLAKRFCEEFNLSKSLVSLPKMTVSPSSESGVSPGGDAGIDSGKAVAIYQLVEIPVGHRPSPINRPK
ncbi:MAG: hypothetical protein JNL67_14845 [Planctomycetaceae bacterium]|nr:hypothetical protein [Planctomycetaceae bacterium]